MATFKLQVQDDDAHPQSWRDVKSDDGNLLLFTKESDARTRLAEQFPVLVKMEQFAAGPKRTRVVIVNPYQDIDKEKEE
jgi:hypothetical protein